MVEVKHHDWPRLLQEISRWYRRKHRRRLTDYQLGRMAPRPNGKPNDKKVVAGWKKGVQPGHYEGECILGYHREYVLRTAAHGENFPTTFGQAQSATA